MFHGNLDIYVCYSKSVDWKFAICCFFGIYIYILYIILIRESLHFFLVIQFVTCLWDGEKVTDPTIGDQKVTN